MDGLKKKITFIYSEANVQPKESVAAPDGHSQRWNRDDPLARRWPTPSGSLRSWGPWTTDTAWRCFAESAMRFREALCSQKQPGLRLSETKRPRDAGPWIGGVPGRRRPLSSEPPPGSGARRMPRPGLQAWCAPLLSCLDWGSPLGAPGKLSLCADLQRNNSGWHCLALC